MHKKHWRHDKFLSNLTEHNNLVISEIDYVSNIIHAILKIEMPGT